jgi:hypothetical protein
MKSDSLLPDNEIIEAKKTVTRKKITLSEQENVEYHKKVCTELEKLVNSKSELTALNKYAEIIMKEYFHVNFLDGLTEEDFVHIAFEKIISGKRRWNENYPLKKMVYLAICSEIRNAYKKSSKNIKVRLDNSENINTEENDFEVGEELDEYEDVSVGTLENSLSCSVEIDYDSDNQCHSDFASNICQKALNSLENSENNSNNIIDYCVLSYYLKNGKWNVKRIASESTVSVSEIANSIKRIKRLITKIGKIK